MYRTVWPYRTPRVVDDLKEPCERDVLVQGRTHDNHSLEPESQGQEQPHVADLYCQAQK